MKVFISWSGDLSQKVAEALHQWLRLVVQATEPWISSEGIDKGAIWFSEVSEQLAATTAGIVCVTKDNLESPWLLFEAGGLANKLTKSRVFTLLIDVGHSDLKPPLSQFNGTLLAEDDMLKLVKSINAGLGDKALPDEVLREAFNAHWPQLAKKIGTLKQAHQSTPHTDSRSIQDLIEEILETSRATYTAIQESPNRRPLVGPISQLVGPIGHASESQIGEALGKLLTQTVKSDVVLGLQLKAALQEWIQRVRHAPVDLDPSVRALGFQ